MVWSMRGLVRTLFYILESTKPKQTALMLLTMLGAYAAGYVISGSEDFSLAFLLALLAMGYLAVGGTTLLNMYFDVDIDSIMMRTMNRPLPSRKLDKNIALICGVLMVLSSLVIAWNINIYVLATIVVGFVFDILGYTILLKRRSPFSIFAGAVAGSMPALGGWAAATGSLNVPAFLLASLVFLWQPLHVWFLSYFYSEDYMRAGIPSLPLIVKPTAFGSVVLTFLALFVLAVAMFVLVTGYGVVALFVSFFGSLRVSQMILKFIENSERTLAWKIFKLATPLLALTFILISLEAAVRFWLF
ncbi:MAG: heme o synthase [Acidilobaceae archaeon]